MTWWIAFWIWYAVSAAIMASVWYFDCWDTMLDDGITIGQLCGVVFSIFCPFFNQFIGTAFGIARISDFLSKAWDKTSPKVESFFDKKIYKGRK